jgi:DNA-binding NarL/FixJ family response regulator
LDFHSDPKSVQNGDSASPSGKNLSSRQREVLNLIIRGYSNKEIARALDLAEGTVKIHVAVLFSKLGVHRRAALAAAGASLLPQRFGALGMSLVGSASR